MIANVYLVIGDDSYQAEIDTSTETLKVLWRYRSNRPARPEPVVLDSLDFDIQQQLDRKIIKLHGFSILD